MTFLEYYISIKYYVVGYNNFDYFYCIRNLVSKKSSLYPFKKKINYLLRRRYRYNIKSGLFVLTVTKIKVRVNMAAVTTSV